MTRPVVTPFGPVANPRGSVLLLHRGGVRPINPATIARIHGDHDQAAEIERKQREERISAMPSARAGRASHRAVLRRLGHSATITIAVFCIVYFGGQLLRGAF
jgi:hypothetical protein